MVIDIGVIFQGKFQFNITRIFLLSTAICLADNTYYSLTPIRSYLSDLEYMVSQWKALFLRWEIGYNTMSHGYKRQRSQLVNLRDGLDVSLDAFNKTSIYFAYEEAPTERGLEVSLSSLRSNIYYLFREFDSSGLTRAIAQEAPAHLQQQQFSYSQSNEFTKYVQDLVNEKYPDLQIPQPAWQKIWLIIDQQKDMLLSDMRQSESKKELCLFFLYRCLS